MGISYEGMQVFGSDIYGKKKNNYNPCIEQEELENKIEEVYGIILNEDRYEEMLDEGMKEEEINYQEYTSKYTNVRLGDYKALMIIQSGNYVIGKYDFTVGFTFDLNRESFEKIEEKKRIFKEELEDFRTKTGFTVNQPRFVNLQYVV